MINKQTSTHALGLYQISVTKATATSLFGSNFRGRIVDKSTALAMIFRSSRALCCVGRLPLKNYALPARLYGTAEKKKLQKILTIPNALSLSRIVIAPFVGHAVLADRPFIALSLISITAASDFADGYIARRFHQRSALGTLLDPIGDKILVGILTASLTLKGSLPLWLAILMIAKDIGLILSGLYIRWRSLPKPASLSSFFDVSKSTTTISPTNIGKLNTALQFVLLGVSTGISLIPDASMGSIKALLNGFYYIVAGTTVASVVSYIRNYRKVVKFIKP